MTIEGSRFLVGIGIDITERKLAEDAQKQAERRYRDLFEQANEGLLLMTTDGQLTQINNVFVEMHGYNAEDFKAKSITDLDVLKERTLEDRAEIIRRMNAGETVRFEVEHYHKDGHVFPIAVSTRLITLNGQPFYLSSHRDITEHKLAQKALQQAQAILQAAMDQSTAGIAIADAPGGELRYVNDAGLLIRGGARETVVNGIGINQYVASWKILDFDGRPLRADEVPLSRAIMFGETCSRDFIIRRAEGDDRVVLAKAAPIRDESGKIVAGIVVFMDITEARRTEQEKEKLHSQLAQAQKLESIGRLAGGVAHDFNNLLMGMLNYVELCRDKLPPEHPIRPFLAEITSDANRSADLTRQLLAFARKQTIAPRVLDMNDAVGDMRKLLGRLLGENISLTWSPCPALWKVKLDPAQVDQILANLCVNARDAIAGVGRLNIETCNVTADEPYCAGNADAVPGEYVLLTVSDTGHGMSKEVLSHIFEPFFTTKELGKGTGLGLATVFGIVTQNKGFITVYSEPGKGTAFKIHLPRCAAPAPEAQIAETPTKPPRGTETILLVEDEKSVRVTTKLFLEDLGYKVLVADHPGKALTLAAQHPDEIHLLITDVIMPNMSGSDLAGKLCSARPSLKRLFISGFTADIIAKEGVLESSMHFLTKPFGRDVLARKVREVLEGNEK
jgi:PAS domain S-box-containing protein